MAAIGKELHNARRQKERLHELLELGEYDLPTYRERMKAVMDKITALEGQQERYNAFKVSKQKKINPFS